MAVMQGSWRSSSGFIPENTGDSHLYLGWVGSSAAEYIADVRFICLCDK